MDYIMRSFSLRSFSHAKIHIISINSKLWYDKCYSTTFLATETSGYSAIAAPQFDTSIE